MTDTAHHEAHFERCIALKLEPQGWLVGDTRHDDTEHALDRDDLIAWLEATQPEKWAKLQYHPGHKLAIDLVLFINGLPVASTNRHSQ